jgi:hypothetical protein
MTRGEFAHFLVILLVDFLSVVLADLSSQKRSPQYSTVIVSKKSKTDIDQEGLERLQIPKEVISDLKRENQGPYTERIDF